MNTATSDDPARPTTPAVGGTHRVPVPDPVARDYLLLALRLDQHVPGLVDGYFGPADLKAQVDLEALRPPARLADDARALRLRLAAELPPGDRRTWLDAQLIALEAQAEAAAGHARPYLDHVRRCFDWSPVRRPETAFEAAAAALDALLPGTGPVAERLDADDAAWTVDPAAARAIVDHLLARFRERAATLIGLPEGEDLRISFVRNQPWSGYNWYDGARRSRVDLNTDLPLRIPALVTTVAHETYPGHHLEHALKEATLVDAAGRLEASLLAINTPECLISEGLANLGRRFVVRPDEEAGMLEELATIGGLALATDPAALREAAERRTRLGPWRAVLEAVRVNAALLRHVDGLGHDEVLAYLVEVGRMPSLAAAKRLEFIEHPLWRTYVFVYTEGEALLTRWLDVAPESEQPARFRRLLTESLTPSVIAAELASA